MRKSKFKIETLVLTLALAVIMPLSANGQRGGSDGFFRGGSDDYETRADVGISGGITNDSFDAPIGDGMLIMLTAGLCYVAFRRKRVLAIVPALVVLLSMAQCRKERHVAGDNESCVITLDVGDGSKTDVNPLNGTVKFVEGDEIIVSNMGKYVGRLTYNGTIFSGTIKNPTANTYLYFYHLGNADVGTLTEGSSSGCYASIAEQITSLPVISYAQSTERYSSGVTSFSAQLQNKCALVKFDVTTSSDYAGVCIKGVTNKVYVDFSNRSFTYSMDGEGCITMPPGDGEKWAVLFPQEAVSEGGAGSAISGLYSGTRGAIPEVVENACLADGVPVSIDTWTLPAGAKASSFTVGANGEQVYFSQGNLIYNKNTRTWRFHDQQYGRLFKSNVQLGTDCYYYQEIDHYSWGANGFDHGAQYYMPQSTTSDNAGYYAYGDVSKNLYDENGIADWGINAITNGGNAYQQWRVLTMPEWNYLLFDRDNADELRAFATINVDDKSITGLIIMPDDWTKPQGISINTETFTFANNTYDVEQWTMLENNGAIFLPSSGRRSKSTALNGVNQVGYYWSSSSCNATKSYIVLFSSTGFDRDRSQNRYEGMSVRLVVG